MIPQKLGCTPSESMAPGTGYLVAQSATEVVRNTATRCADKHNVCRLCSTHRSKLTETPWGHPEGFTCKPCQDAVDAVAKAAALAKVAESDYDEWDYRNLDECKCPHCATVIHIETEDYGDKNMECDTCDGLFELQIEFEPNFTTTVIGERVTA